MWWKVYLLIVNNVIIKYNKKGLVIKKNCYDCFV